jgi:hypothetical protein
VLPRVHGSSLFQRGETQGLVHRHPRHLRGRPGGRRLSPAASKRCSSSCTTTSRPSRSVRPAVSA